MAPYREADALGPVSYTHLDVYKRQVLEAARAQDDGAVLHLEGKGEIFWLWAFRMDRVGRGLGFRRGLLLGPAGGQA